MPVAGGGFEQCYNAQAAVAAGSLLVVATDVVQAPNDKCQVEPTLERIAALPEELGEVENLLADTGYFSADNVEACDKAGVTPVIAMGRQPHHPPLSERFAPAPEAPKEPTPVEAMAHRLKTAAAQFGWLSAGALSLSGTAKSSPPTELATLTSPARGAATVLDMNSVDAGIVEANS